MLWGITIEREVSIQTLKKCGGVYRIFSFEFVGNDKPFVWDGKLLNELILLAKNNNLKVTFSKESLLTLNESKGNRLLNEPTPFDLVGL